MFDHLDRAHDVCVPVDESHELFKTIEATLTAFQQASKDINLFKIHIYKLIQIHSYLQIDICVSVT